MSEKRLFTIEEKRLLVKRLEKAKESVSLSSLYENSDLVGKIPSKRTLYRLLQRLDSVKIHDTTAQQIENLLLIVGNTKAEVASDNILFSELYTSLQQLLRISRSQNRAFLKAFSGSYKCIRLTTKSKEILVTYMYIYGATGYIPRFKHIEVVPDEADLPGNRKARVISHYGFILPELRKATFLAFDGQIRQISCQISSNTNQPTFSGLLLTRDALDDHPFVSRVFIEKTEDISHESVVKGSTDYGLFALDDPLYSSYLSYIENIAFSNGALYSVVSI